MEATHRLGNTNVYLSRPIWLKALPSVYLANIRGKCKTPYGNIPHMVEILKLLTVAREITFDHLLPS